MKPSKKFLVPLELALLYDFVNSLDLRQYTEKGKQHEGHDELSTAGQLEQWMREHGLLDTDAHVSAHAHRLALRLRGSVRDYLQEETGTRASPVLARLNELSSAFPLVLAASRGGKIDLEPAPSSSGLARVLAQLYRLAVAGRLERLKMCASEQCRWVFFDRSKPGNRRWCSSVLCGNRHKTRNYRRRQRERAETEQNAEEAS
jgi:predicted RNA-binding Zn ribbon-like protein